MSELSEWFTAIGTVATAIVAMVVAFIPSIRRWYNRPRFSIEFENEKPFCRVTTVIRQLAVDGAGSTTLAYWIRLRIRNIGRSVAKACEGKLVRIKDAETKEESKDFDPVVLRWVSTQAYKPVDINKKEYEYLDLVYRTAQDDEVFIVADRKLRMGINLNLPLKDYIFYVIIYGENVEPLEKAFYLKKHKEYDKIELLPFEEEKTLGENERKSHSLQ